LLAVAYECTPATPGKADPLAILCQELDACNKQFDVLMKQNASLLTARSKGDGGSGNGGSSKEDKQCHKLKNFAPTAENW
jgi:hypothetical protein